ncbi:aminotransferase class I/II-fold pyridoxal phosphate-dependent enzyme [Rhodalgimonas zhirmunskyi]|uniref:Aminotransferase class I/II-fold pyridoxal phosphate-dependent enzyme n=1 Tax=Rhodalgimonas zhirmunskyi TaxID=2964767 RepID=A0AAJ1UAM5_9RHOB|nr:aminotransferase class I/II-fold pyridoxal phosphate-dependent enzyme [Rhodoalgimonas zhirmunskyi]MDQ2094203.1 aminotransferase class I/II-fold pyridoxal phosphate-dependent enzyme [Rhodoalgimonas zhirmunskyi]
MFPDRFSNLPEYAFPRLRALLDPLEPGGEEVHMTIGEPKHAFPAWVKDIIAENADDFGRYPTNEGTPGLLQAIGDWVSKRFDVKLDPQSQIMALNGTREGLYNAAMALVPEQVRGEQALILMPNPFYQVYMVAAMSIGAKPIFVPATRGTGYLPDYAGLPTDMLNRTAAAYICSPSNPQGAVASREYLRELIELAEHFDFKIFADECYSEIYRKDAPPGALDVAQEMGADPERVVIFHSLSKRSNLPGLRSGFIAGGPESIKRMRTLRAFAGAPLPLPLQAAAEAVWRDEEHVIENRRLYQEKYTVADQVFSSIQAYQGPEAGFFLWLPVENGEAATKKLWQETGIRVLPGEYLARDVNGQNPGREYIRVAMVTPKEEMEHALIRLRDCIYK